jgi:outer membrane receptor protein involved in Fe transport
VAAAPGIIPATYKPESLWTYEAGTKQQWLDRRLILEGAVFYNDWKDVQTTFFLPGSTLGAITNGGKVQGWGVDLSLTARPTTGLTLVGTYGWNNMQYKTASAQKAPGDPVDLAVQESWSLSADYRRPVFGEVQGFARLDYQHAGPSYISYRDLGISAVNPAHGLLSARVGLDFGRFEASVFADNLTDNDTLLLPAVIGLGGQGVEQTPRTDGVNLKAHF